MTFGNPPNLADLVSALKSLLVNETATITLLNGDAEQIAEAYRRADPINVAMAEQICRLADIPWRGFTKGSRTRKLMALRKITTEKGASVEEANTAQRLADALEAED